MKLSKLFWLAANKHLWDGVRPYADTLDSVAKYSCDAVAFAIEASGPDDWIQTESALYDEAAEFLRELGCPSGSLEAFFLGNVTRASDAALDRYCDDCLEGRLQQVRYQWLMFAAMIAEEEGR